MNTPDPRDPELVRVAENLRALDTGDGKHAAAADAILRFEAALRNEPPERTPPFWQRFMVATVGSWSPRQRLAGALLGLLIVTGAITSPITAVVNAVGGCF